MDIFSNQAALISVNNVPNFYHYYIHELNIVNVKLSERRLILAFRVTNIVANRVTRF
jgi:hypothetical protein